MSQLLHLLQGSLFLNSSSCTNFYSTSQALLLHKSCWCTEKDAPILKYTCLKFSLQGQLSRLNGQVKDDTETCSFPCKVKSHNEVEPNTLPYVQTLRKFPKEELSGKVVMVRFDSTVLLRERQGMHSVSITTALSTIKYLYEAGARVILGGSWGMNINANLITADSVAGFLSSALQIRVLPVKFGSDVQSIMEDGENPCILLLENLSQLKEEPANCSKFAEKLSSGVDIFVNDAFSQSHKVLASTVGTTRFCYASIAGFHFEENLNQLKRAVKTGMKPFIGIIGGGNLFNKAAAFHFLASRCDALAFVGHMAFQIMHALGMPVPMKLVEPGALEDALNIVELAKLRGTQILFPKDFWCIKDHPSKEFGIFPAHCISDGWRPVDLGPRSLDEMTSLISRGEKIIWIGPMKFSSSSENLGGLSKLALTLHKLSHNHCDVTVVGNMAFEAFVRESSSLSVNMIKNASVVWEFLKGRGLPGLLALDRAFPFDIDWGTAYSDPARPLVVDIGSGNGLFLFRMARRRKDLNFLGLEINEKLVNSCLCIAYQSGMENGHFIATNATTTFRSIVSSYPGQLVIASIQCPNPDFSKPDHRWRMLKRSLIEGIVDLLASDGQVFLQSDIEAVAIRMKEEFLKYGKGKLAIMDDLQHLSTGREWLKENPFGAQSDWEQHVIDKGKPMYRLMLSKSTSKE